MLRASGEHSGDAYDLASVMSDRGAVDSVPHGPVLMELVEAAYVGDESRLVAARRAVRTALGDAAFVDACATFASFSAVVKIADGTGIPLEDYKEAATRDIRRDLGIDALQI